MGYTDLTNTLEINALNKVSDYKQLVFSDGTNY